MHTDRPSHGLVFYVGGETRFCFGEQTLAVKKNDVIYLPKHSDYTVESSGDETGIVCYAVNFDVRTERDFPPMVMSVKNAAAILSLFKQAEQAWRTKRSGYEMECKAELYHVLCALRREWETGYITASTASFIEPAVAYIHRNYTADTISVSHLADLCGMSETYFRSIFRKVKGVSPLKYINGLKLNRAAELLSSQMYSVSRVAVLSGFHDEAYFSREFKKATGVCPSQYAA